MISKVFKHFDEEHECFKTLAKLQEILEPVINAAKKRKQKFNQNDLQSRCPVCDEVPELDEYDESQSTRRFVECDCGASYVEGHTEQRWNNLYHDTELLEAAKILDN